MGFKHKNRVIIFKNVEYLLTIDIKNTDILFNFINNAPFPIQLFRQKPKLPPSVKYPF